MTSSSASAPTGREAHVEEHGRERVDTTSSTSGENPYVHSETAMCIRDSEGSFEERRGRLDSALRNSLKVSRTDLLQRNIFQGVNVVRRGSRQLEEKLSARPPLEEMISKRRLTADYVDKVFPDRLEDSVAPSAERIERVSLHRLLAPPARKQGSLSATAASNGTSAKAPQSQGTQLDPAMLAAMVVQAAMMSKSNDPRPNPGAPQQVAQTMPGQMWPGQVGQTRPNFDATWPKMMSPYLRRPDVAANCPPDAENLASSASSVLMGSTQQAPSTPIVVEGRPGQPLNISAYIAQPKVAKPKQDGASVATSPPMFSQGMSARMPKPPVQVTRIEGDRSQKPAFIRLLDEFCERTLNKDVSGSVPMTVAPPTS